MRKAMRLIILLLILTVIFTTTTACKDKGYSISFVSFGEEVAVIKLKGTGEVTLPTLSKDGYTFLGWFLDENFWNNPFTETYFFEKKIDKNYVVYARWKEIENVTINFETFGGEELVSIVTKQGSTANLPTPQRDGYSFLYWCLSKDLNSKADNSTVFYKDTKLFAKWLSDTPVSQNFVIKLNIIPENPPMEITIGYGQKLIIPKVRRVSYRLDDFYVDERLSHKFDTNIVVTTDFTLYANWIYVDEVFTVNFETNSTSKINTLSVRYDDIINAPYVEKEGYFFEGWYIDQAFSREFNFNNGIIESITLYAKWREEGPQTPQRDYYIITYINNGGNGISSFAVNIGQEPTLSIPTKGNEKFGGWYLDANFTIPYDFDAGNIEDITLYAKWNTELTEQNFVFEESTAENGLILLSYSGSEEVVTIPDTVSGKNVVAIGGGAFKQKNITSVVLPKYLKTIYNEAFFDTRYLIEITQRGFELRNIGEKAFAQTGLRNLSFGENLLTVGSRAFAESALVSITISGQAIIGEEAFLDCKELKTVNMGKVIEIYQSAFYGCSNLTTVTLTNCQTINAWAFSRCIALESINLPSCTSLGSEAFSNCTNLTEIILPNVITLEAQAFMSSGLISIDLPKVETIGNSALENCWNLIDVTIGDYLTVTGLGENVFVDSYKIFFNVDINSADFSSVNGSLLSKDGSILIAAGNISEEYGYSIPENVTSIDSFAFSSGKKIKKINMGASVNNVGMSLAMIEDLEEVTVSDENEIYFIEDGILYSYENEQKVLIRYMPQSAEETFTFDDTITSIASGAFAHCAYLKTVILHESMTVVPFAAFYMCYSLEAVINTEQITEYQGYCFADCTNLTSDGIIFGDDTVVIIFGDNAFSGTQVELPQE